MRFRLTYYRQDGTGNVLTEGTLKECEGYITAIASSVERDPEHELRQFEYTNPLGLSFPNLKGATQLYQKGAVVGSYHLEPVV